MREYRARWDVRAWIADEAKDAKWKVWPNFCQMKKDDSSTKQIPMSHLWLWYILGVLLYCCWLLVVTHVQHSTKRRLNRSKAFATSNFCVQLSNLNGIKGDNAKLGEFAQRYGDVRVAFHVRTLGRVVHICKKACRPRYSSHILTVLLRLFAPSASIVETSTTSVSGSMYRSHAILKRWSQNFEGNMPGNRRAISGIFPTNDGPKWFNTRQGYSSGALNAEFHVRTLRRVVRIGKEWSLQF
jgi:hypothetical protein